jgi:hypothetical protein
MLDLWREHRPDLLWAATAWFLDDLAQSTRTHGVRILYKVRDIPLPPLDCPAASVRADLLSGRREIPLDAISPDSTLATHGSTDEAPHGRGS